jgi:hypothetical protein
MGTAGHMQHPFDVKTVKTGRDLIQYFEKIAQYLTTTPGSVKFDGINVSFKLVDDPSTPTGKDFRMDRGTSEPSSVRGMTTADAYDKWPEGHGMPPAIEELLTIFNQAIKDIEPELKALKMWDDPTKFFNTEYMKKGRTNVIEYPEKILALHGVNQFYEKKAQPFRVRKGIGMDRPGLKRPIDPTTEKPIKVNSTEINYDKAAFQSIINKVARVAEKYDVSLVGDVATEVQADVNYDEVLNEPFTIQMTEEKAETFPLKEWLDGVANPFETKIKRKDGREVYAISKEVYFNILDGVPVFETYETPDDVKMAINGAVFNHGTRMLGIALKKAVGSTKGSLSDHEGIVIRGLENRPVKVTGDFIVKGASGAIKDKIKAAKQTLAEGIDGKKAIAIYPGRFQPMGRHHAAVYKKLLQDPRFDDVYIATSGKIDMSDKDGVPKSPFSFEEKEMIAGGHGIDKSKFIQVKNPYSAEEITEKLNPETIVVYFVGKKDMGENARFGQLGGLTKKGTPRYFKAFNEEDNYEGVKDHAYIAVAPHVEIDIPDYGEMSGTTIRQALSSAEPEEFETIMGFYDPVTYAIVKDKLSQAENEEPVQEVAQMPLGIFFSLIEEVIEEKRKKKKKRKKKRKLTKSQIRKRDKRAKEIMKSTKKQYGKKEGKDIAYAIATNQVKESEDLEETATTVGLAGAIATVKKDETKNENYLYNNGVKLMESVNKDELRLRRIIKESLNVMSKNKAKDEQRLRNILQHLIQEVKGNTDVADSVVHDNTGINVLDDLLKNIIKTIEKYYKNLASTKEERASFRYHFLVNFKNALQPINVNRDAAAPINEQEDEEEEETFNLKIKGGDDDITSEPDPSKFLPARPEDDKTEEKEKEFIRADSADPAIKQGADFAEKAFNDTEKQILSAYESLTIPEDAKMFYDYGLTNLKLYFDKFESEMTNQIGQEPASPDYDKGTEEPKLDLPPEPEADIDPEEDERIKLQ